MRYGEWGDDGLEAESGGRQKTMKKQSVARILNVLVALFAVCFFFPPLAVAEVIADGDYLIQMADSDLAVVSSGITVREQVTLGKNMKAGIWHFKHLGKDYYKVTAPKRAMVLDSKESKKYNGVPIIIFPWHGGRNQRWKVIARGEFYSLINQETGLALDLKGNVQRAGSVFQGYTENSSRGQLFRLTPQSEESFAPKSPVNQEEEQPMKSFSNGPSAR